MLVCVADANGRVVGRTESSSGRFVLSVAPGSYEVSVQTPRYLIGTTAVDAVAGQTAKVRFTDRRLG